MEQFRICKDCDFSGVYAIVNITKQKIYIGSSRNIKRRLTNHRANLEHGKSPETGYNKKDNEKTYLIELSNIKYASQELNHYFSLFSPNCWLGRKTKTEDKKKFINTVLNKKGRF